MKHIQPFTSSAEALSKLDNGGRLWDFSSKANDGNISKAELAKAAGVFSSTQKIMLYLEMHLSELSSDESAKIRAALDPDLQSLYLKNRPKRHSIATAATEAQPGSPIITQGIPELVDAKTAFLGFIMIPIVTNGITTFSMIPIIDQYDVYRLKVEGDSTEFLIAHGRGKKKLDNRQQLFGGIIKSLEKENSGTDKFLEVLYVSSPAKLSEN